MYRQRVNKRKRFIRFFLFLVILFLPVYFLFRPHQSAAVISPIPDDFNAPISQTPTEVAHTSLLNFLSKAKKPDNLKTPLKALADKKWNNYSILVVDFNSDFVMGLNESAIYEAASVNKIPILATLWHKASQGNIDLTKTITMQAKDVQDYGTGSMRYDRIGTVYSIQTLARLMIQKSDNTAAYIIANHILKLSEIQSYIESLGATQTDMMKNTTSNKDIALLFQKIFNGNVANTALTAEMIGLLKDTDFEDRLPAMLPDGVTVYHKIGTGVGAVHDVGVVEFEKNKYYIGIFTNDITDEEQTSEEVAQISKAVFEFMR